MKKLTIEQKNKNLKVAVYNLKKAERIINKLGGQEEPYCDNQNVLYRMRHQINSCIFDSEFIKYYKK